MKAATDAIAETEEYSQDTTDIEDPISTELVYAGPHLPTAEELYNLVQLQAAELQDQGRQIEKLQHHISISRFGIKRFGYDDSLINFYTGFFAYELLIYFYDCIAPTATNMKSPYYARAARATLQGRPRSMPIIDELFMVLCRIRLGLLEIDLADWFSIASSSVSRIVVMWINFLYMLLGKVPIWLSRDALKTLMPKCFKDTYPDTRVIIDCNEIKTQYASSLKVNSQLYSHYKNAPTFKGLIGIAPMV